MVRFDRFEYINDFNRKWLKLARDKMKDNATIWISGTYHNIFSIGKSTLHSQEIAMYMQNALIGTLLLLQVVVSAPD